MDMDKQQLIRYLVAHLKCIACRHKYDIDDVQVLEEGAGLLVLLMTCQHCQAQGLLMALVQDQQVKPRRADQAEQRRDVGPITADDVLDVHRLLEGFDGDCSALLAGLPQSE